MLSGLQIAYKQCERGLENVDKRGGESCLIIELKDISLDGFRSII